MNTGNAEAFANWAVELCDGVLVIQRSFQFRGQTGLDVFKRYVRKLESTPHVTLFIEQGGEVLNQLTVRIQAIPESENLQAAGAVAAACEFGFNSVIETFTQSAA
jgi:hypothetical protein